ncbi:hypothetical protein ANANG_G00177900 [Anguilla anguilla]|uniref:Uncharacterized protein n=1 Tax=Anguilla anguilla TaxID=7936 RepID=A0A9D3M7Y3_ANGAN|nr:hypothetical protein ANANG_G00177900 [Anguilla anguilla]
MKKLQLEARGPQALDLRLMRIRHSCAYSGWWRSTSTRQRPATVPVAVRREKTSKALKYRMKATEQIPYVQEIIPPKVTPSILNHRNGLKRGLIQNQIKQNWSLHHHF